MVTVETGSVASVTSNGSSFLVTPDVSPLGGRNVWTPFVEDHDTQSFSYYLPAATGAACKFASSKDLDRWFQELHPSNYSTDDHDDGASWTEARYKGDVLLRQTAWCVWEKGCTCEYGYSDTWQPILQSKKMKKTIDEITLAVSKAVNGASSANNIAPFNSCNLNYYPAGGGVGFHADDEFLFDGLQRSVRIVSLSLTAGEAENKGARTFQIRKKQQGEDGNTSNPKHNNLVQEISLGHGDLVTMEGYFQKHYLHSIWPGDSKEYLDHPLTQGERINLTWRTIVKHLDGSEECRGKICPLSGECNS